MIFFLSNCDVSLMAVSCVFEFRTEMILQKLKDDKWNRIEKGEDPTP